MDKKKRKPGAGRKPAPPDFHRHGILVSDDVYKHLDRFGNASKEIERIGRLDMAEKIEITFGQDLDAFLGRDDDAIAMIDIEKSKVCYKQAICGAIAKVYPELAVEFVWGGGSNFSDAEYADPDTYADIQGVVREIAGRIYNLGHFWVYRSGHRGKMIIGS